MNDLLLVRISAHQNQVRIQLSHVAPDVLTKFNPADILHILIGNHHSG